MSVFIDDHLGIAASVFLVFFLVYFCVVCYVMIQVRGVWNRYFTLLLFSLFRIAGQVSGIAFAKLGMSHWKWLICYLVFSAEGYFSLILSSFYILVDEQRTFFGESTLGANNIRIFKRKISAKRLFHLTLIPANSLVIIGGTMNAGLSTSDFETKHGQITKSKALRTAGQVMFLSLSILALAATFYNYFLKRLKAKVLIPIMCATPFLLVRGVFGILAIYVSAMDYFSFSNYGSMGTKAAFTIYDYVMGATMELCSAVLLLSTFFIKRRWPQDKQISDTEESISDIKVEEFPRKVGFKS